MKLPCNTSAKHNISYQEQKRSDGEELDSDPLESVERNNTKTRDPNSDANSRPQMMKLALTSNRKEWGQGMVVRGENRHPLKGESQMVGAEIC
uniref:Uncharacterized protein n=1 Tax=Brassica campestris TaxID=3711 RepID=M4DJL8_BRACM